LKSKDIMAEHLIIKGETKEELYATLLPQLKSLVEGESDIIANMANISACIMDTFRFWWVGFYRVIDGTLVLGPFQGPLACTRIKRGKGVCGTAWDKAETIVVEDVEKFPGHIACSSASRSEIVVPVIRNGEVIAVLDIDSEHLNTFDDIDKEWLEKVAELFAAKAPSQA
jgi:L-methionine (R)-S-oxide reductase